MRNALLVSFAQWIVDVEEMVEGKVVDGFKFFFKFVQISAKNNIRLLGKMKK